MSETALTELLELLTPPAAIPELIPEPEPSRLILPVSYTPQNAQMRTKIVFWYNPKTDHIMQGAPEHFDPIYGYQKIVCNHAHEAESWSARLNAQDKRFQEMNDYERECIEGHMRSNLRAEIRRNLDTPPDGLNQKQMAVRTGLLKMALSQLDEQELRGKTIRDSYLHAEAYEAGK